MDWRCNPVPYDDGRLVLVILHPDAQPELEHHGQPIVARCWCDKFRTTAGAHAIAHSDVAQWCQLEQKSVFLLSAYGIHKDTHVGHLVVNTVVYRNRAEAEARVPLFTEKCCEFGPLVAPANDENPDFASLKTKITELEIV